MGLNCTNHGGCRFPKEGLCLASCSFTWGPEDAVKVEQPPCSCPRRGAACTYPDCEHFLDIASSAALHPKESFK